MCEEATFRINKRVEHEMEVTLDKLPFGMTTGDICNFMQVDYDMSLGNIIRVELDTRDFEELLHDYKKEIPREDNVTVYADEYCMIRSVVNSGSMYYELVIPFSNDDFEETIEDEIEVELY